MAKNWKLRPEITSEIKENLKGYPSLIAQLLYNRGIYKAAEAEAFLNVSYEGLHDPFLFKDMKKAVERIWRAIENGEKIYIYGDYDADAVTASAVLIQAFSYLGVKVFSYIPDRFTEGYGVNLEAIEKIKNEGASVIITVDCGTNSSDAAQYCRNNGIDFIITDHHEIIGEIPDAYALINPKNPEDFYPYHEITGVGVAFKLACALLQNEKSLVQNPDFVFGYEKWLLDLVAIGTVADCHSLLGENRALVTYGLKVLPKTKWAGLRSLMEVAKLEPSKKPLDTYTLGFVIAPRLNAAGRLEHAGRALETLIEKDFEKAREFAKNLEQINIRRQDQTQRMVSEAKDQVLALQDRKVLVVLGEGWNKGVVGLVAGRLAEEFRKPSIVLEKGEFESTGSARSVGEFNIVEALKSASEHLVRFGGHMQAAGLTLKTKEFDRFYAKILEYAEKNLREEDTDPALFLDAEIEPEIFSEQFFLEQKKVSFMAYLARFEPFGVNNPKPKFLLKNAHVVSVKYVGATAQHMQIFLDIKGYSLQSIYFNATDFAKNLKIGDTIDVAAEFMEDLWNGKVTLKARILDIHFSNNS